MRDLAPIIFICYNRYNHVVRSLNSLKKNKLSKKSKIIIFADGPTDKTNKKKTDRIKIFLKKINGFKSKKIIFRKKKLRYKKKYRKCNKSGL